MKAIEEYYNENKDVVEALEEPIDQSYIRVVRGALTKAAYVITKNWEDAEDAVQDAYVKALKYYKEEGVENIESWFCIVIRNCAKDIYVKNKRFAPCDSSPGSEDYNVDESEKEHLEEGFLNDEAIEEIMRVSKKMPTHYQDIITLKFFYKHSYAEIVDVLGVTRRTAIRAVTKLREGLKDEVDR